VARFQSIGAAGF